MVGWREYWCDEREEKETELDWRGGGGGDPAVVGRVGGNGSKKVYQGCHKDETPRRYAGRVFSTKQVAAWSRPSQQPTANSPRRTPPPSPLSSLSSPFFAFLSLSPSFPFPLSSYIQPHLLNMSSAKVYVGTCAGSFDL